MTDEPKEMNEYEKEVAIAKVVARTIVGILAIIVGAMAGYNSYDSRNHLEATRYTQDATVKVEQLKADEARANAERAMFESLKK